MGNIFNSHSIIIFTDVSEEIDDQLFLKWLYSNDKFGATFTIVFCPTNKNTSDYGRSLWKDKYLPHTYHNKTNGSTFKYLTIEEFSKIPSIIYDYGIIISPLKDYNAENLNINYKIFLQGSEAEKSFNTISSEKVINRFRDEDKLIEIPSHKCCMMRPTSDWLKTLPVFYQDQIALIGFKLLIGRMSTNIIIKNGLNVSKLYAEGLINPKVKNTASNYNATKSLLNIKTICSQTPCGINIEDLVPDLIHTQVATRYMQDIFGKDTDYAKDYNGSIECLSKMCKAIDIITETDMFSSRNEVYYSDFNEDFNEDLKLKRAFNKFKECLNTTIGGINFLNPVYDLFAGMVAINYIKTGNYKDDYTVEEFFSLV